MKPQIFIKVIFVLVIILASSNVYSTSYYVNDASKTGDIWCAALGSNSNAGTKNAPFATLKYALSVAAANDKIYVDAGTYLEKQMTISLSNLSIIGAGPGLTKFAPASPGMTLVYFMKINGVTDFLMQDLSVSGYNNVTSGEGEAITITNVNRLTFTNIAFGKSAGGAGESVVTIGSNSTNVTIQGISYVCQTQGSSGGGFEITGTNISVAINNSMISNNNKSNGFSGDRGGGLLIKGDATVTVNVTNSSISDNVAGKGAGIYMTGGIFNMTNCCIKNNESTTNEPDYGGGVWLAGTSGLCTFTNCEFSGNKCSGSARGGAIGLNSLSSAVNLSLVNCSFSNNSGSGGNDIYSRLSFGKAITLTADNCSFGSASNSIFVHSGTVTVTNSGTFTSSGTVGGNKNAKTSTTSPSCPVFSGSCPLIFVCNSATVGANQTVICPATTATISATGPSNSVFYLYDASSGGLVLDTASSSTPNFDLTGINATKTYYIVSSLDGCATRVPVSVTYTACAACTTTISYTSPVCKASSNPIVAKNDASVGTFTSTLGLVFKDATTGEIDLAASTPGTYIVTFTVTSNPSCQPTASITIVAKPTTPIIDPITQPTCTASGTVQVNPFDPAATYGFKPATGISISGTGLITASSGTYKFAATKGGCTSDSVTVTFNAVPGKPVLSGAGEICVDSTINLKAWTDNTMITPSTPNSVKPWVSSDPSVASVLNGDVLGESGGTVTITYTDASNCTQTASIKVYPKAVGGTATATSASLCENTTTTINLTGYTGKIQWQFSVDGSTNWTNISGATSTPYSPALLSPGTYYYRAIVTSGVCSSTAISNNVTIKVSPDPVVGTASSTPDTLCAGGTASLKLVGSVGNIQWKESLDGLTGWNNISGTANGNLAICGTAPLSNTMFYKAVLSSGACTDVESAVLKVVVNPNLATSVTIKSDQTETAGEITICPDTKVVFTATPSVGLGTVVYQWKNKGITINLANKSTYSSAGLKDGDIITCELTTVGGKCITGSPATSNPIKVNVLVNDLSLIGSSPTSCNLLDGFIEVKGTGSGTVKWSLVSTPLVILGTHPGVTLTKVAPFETVSGLGKGNYRVTFNNGFCDFSKDVTLTDPSAPQDALLTVSAALPICQGQSITITANVQDVSILTGTTKYHWKKNGLDFNGSQPQAGNSITVNTAGTYSVTLKDGACGSNENDTIITIINTPEDLIVTNSNPIFCKENGKLVSDLKELASNSNLTQTITWYDSPSNGTAFKDDELVTSRIYYAEQSQGACKSVNRTKVDVTIIDLAKPFLPGNNTQPSCSVATGTVEINMPKAGVWDITATPVVGSPVKVTTDNIIVNPFTYSFTGLNPGSYTFKIKDVNGCVSPISTSVVIVQQPVSPDTPVLDVSKVYCASKSYKLNEITFSPAPTGTVKYYDVNDAPISGTTVVVANTVYKFTFDNGKCESKVKLATTIPLDKGPTLDPLVDLSASLLICAIDKPTFNSVIANSTVSIPGGYSLLISVTADGKTIIPNTTEIGALNGATQTVYYNIIDPNECQSTTFAMLKFKINEGPTDLVLKNTKTYCATDNPTIASLNDTKIFSSGALKWYSSETSTNVLPDGTNLTSGTYFASSTLTPGCESVARQSVVVTVQSFGQTILNQTNDYTFCKGTVKKISDLQINPYFSNEIVWLNAYKVVLSPSTELISGTYFAAETKNGCISQNMQEIEVKFTSPIISISPSKLPTCSAGNGSLLIIGAQPSYTYQWSKNGQLMTENGSVISNLPDDQTIKYSVIVTDAKGCYSKDTASFSDCEPAEIPHIITPNGDGKNDNFVLNYESKYPKCNLSILNRWGSVVYETKQPPYKDDWDGKPNVGASVGSNVLPAGTYFYVVDKGDGTSPESGYVELVK